MAEKRKARNKTPGNKLTLKQERFVHSYIETGNASEAYRRAYNCENMKPETIKRNAHALLGNNNITTTVNREKARIAKACQVTVDSLTREYDQNRDLALTVEQPAAANGAVMGKAKLHGLAVERLAIVNVDISAALAEASDRAAGLAADRLDAAIDVPVGKNQAESGG